MISQEFLDELNNSELGKVLRLTHFKCSEETLEEINRRLNKNLSMDFIIDYMKNPLRVMKNKSLMEYIKENNKFIFDLSNIEELKKDGILLCIEKFESGFTKEANMLLTRLIKELDIKQLTIFDNQGNVSLDDLPIEKLILKFGTAENLNLSKLQKLKKIEIHNVTLTDLSSLELTPELESLSINIDESDPQTILTGLKKFQKLKDLRISGAISSDYDKEMIRIITSLSSLEDIDLQFYDAENSNKNQKISSLFDELFDDSELGKNEQEDKEQEKKEGFLIEADDLPFFLNLSALKKMYGYKSNVLRNYMHTPIIKNREELEKLSQFKYINFKEIYYIGKEPVDPALLEKLGDVTFIVSSPLVLDENFCQNFHKNPEMTIRIDNDSLENYELSEISAINDVITQIINGAPINSTDFEKVAYIYKKIGEKVVYDKSGCLGAEEYVEGRESITRSLKGGLIENKLVCRGYALVLKKLLDELRN